MRTLAGDVCCYDQLNNKMLKFNGCAPRWVNMHHRSSIPARIAAIYVLVVDRFRNDGMSTGGLVKSPRALKGISHTRSHLSAARCP